MPVVQTETEPHIWCAGLNEHLVSLFVEGVAWPRQDMDVGTHWAKFVCHFQLIKEALLSCSISCEVATSVPAIRLQRAARPSKFLLSWFVAPDGHFRAESLLPWMRVHCSGI